MNDVFISYRREDSSDICGRIYDRLELLLGAKRVFKDVDNIPPGVDFREHINAALNRCTAALVVIGPKWLSSANADGQRRIDDPDDFVRIEIEGLLKRGVPVIPVLVYGATMPSSTDLPPSLAPLAYRQAVIVRPDPDFRRDVEHVVSALRTSAAKSKPVARPRAEAPKGGSGAAAAAAEWPRGKMVQVASIVSLIFSLIGIAAIGSNSVAAAVTFISLGWLLGAGSAVLSVRRAWQSRRLGWVAALVLGITVGYLVAGLVPLLFAELKIGPKEPA